NGIYHDRLIDIDILLYDNETIETPALTIPHPRMKERRFVLEPLAQIAPELIIPNETKTIAELLADIC
ncbi:MAG: 2-amino-4-hydroxy-6-hydroxymethyldihydropteridine diphosphokinase, partial [Bacteroidaceae bacterium]|nr:2-amino-4-hydroxy-6-hydroxymethyldihydropteridine diphosphokinase [Bacteroidaceae bacterium]